MKSLSSILKSALEAKNAATSKKTKGKRNQAKNISGPTPNSEVITPKKTKRSTRGG